MKYNNTLKGFFRFILILAAIVSIVKVSNSQTWVSQSS